MNSFRATLCIGCALAGVTAAAAQMVVFSQPTDSPEGLFADGHPGSSFNHTRTADNFEVMDATHRRVVELRWWGSPEIEWMDLDNFTEWVVIFYAHGVGLPGEIVHSEVIPMENVNFFPTGEYNMDGGAEYLFTAQLADPPTLAAYTTYWLSIGAGYSDPDYGYRWSYNYLDGNNHCAQDFQDLQGYQSVSEDVAFEILADLAENCPNPGAHGKYCTADIDASQDCVVDLNDLAEMLGAYGFCLGDPQYKPNANIASDGNSCIDLSDLAELLGQYGDVCD